MLGWGCKHTKHNTMLGWGLQRDKAQHNVGLGLKTKHNTRLGWGLQTGKSRHNVGLQIDKTTQCWVGGCKQTKHNTMLGGVGGGANRQTTAMLRWGCKQTKHDTMLGWGFANNTRSPSSCPHIYFFIILTDLSHHSSIVDLTLNCANWAKRSVVEFLLLIKDEDVWTVMKSEGVRAKLRSFWIVRSKYMTAVTTAKLSNGPTRVTWLRITLMTTHMIHLVVGDDPHGSPG